MTSLWRRSCGAHRDAYSVVLRDQPTTGVQVGGFESAGKGDIWKIARRTTDNIESNITNHVCLFDSAASSLSADIGRVPHDIDIVVSEDPEDPYESLDREDIREQIVQAGNRDYLEQSRKRWSAYQILYCRLPGTNTECYVKEDGWWDHRNTPRADFQAKVDDDVSNIIALLESAREEEVSYVDEADEDRHSRAFMHVHGPCTYPRDQIYPRLWHAPRMESSPLPRVNRGNGRRA
ncbi:hypothetical protein DFH94DRAFT_848312 [Russula ochroleuca]|uniref:Uncharacterized protein n=1 Tax=Russula ochroleuca TaxID=152965 RepID=A0A9P5MQ39_9AGAM|nr:hypothetical protein DFH94DRAFT_848312 [Russula ochroleuca]